MDIKTKQLQLQQQGYQSEIPTITIGIVVDTNDPQNMGRLRVICPQWGDSWDTPITDIPWAVYCTPFGGHMQVGTRGPGIQQSEGSVAYGMWAIPKVNAEVAIVCVDGNPMTRMWIGAIYGQLTPHTMPHGRYMYDDHPALEKQGATPVPYGPYTSTEKYIQPLANNIKQQFGNKTTKKFEYQTRGADYTVSRVSVENLEQTYSQVPDDNNVTVDKWTSTQGYQVSRSDPDGKSTITDKNYDSHTYSITTPGFHSLSFDDRQENCRIRLRTTAGHQILLDDTNERIYISPAQGNSWIEIDQCGNIDVYSANRISMHSDKDINFSAKQSIRFTAKNIHAKVEEQVRIDAGKDINIATKGNCNLQVEKNLSANILADTNILTKQNARITSQGKLDIKSTDVLALMSSSVTGITGSAVNLTGQSINLNGPTAPQPVAANPTKPEPAFYVNRKPQHEPYARTMTKNDNSTDPEFKYDDPRVNRVERGSEIPRGMYWRR